MKHLLRLVVIVAALAAVGYYRGWFNVSSESDANQPAFRVSVDKDKVRQDEHKAVEEVQTLEQQAKGKAALTAPATQTAPS